MNFLILGLVLLVFILILEITSLRSSKEYWKDLFNTYSEREARFRDYNEQVSRILFHQADRIRYLENEVNINNQDNINPQERKKYTTSNDILKRPEEFIDGSQEFKDLISLS